MVNKSQIQQKNMAATKRPAKKKAVPKDHKKGLVGAGDDLVETAEWLSAAIGEYEKASRQISESTDRYYEELAKRYAKKDPLKVAIEKFSLSLVSEGMLAMVAMHGILSNGNRVPPDDVAELSVSRARAVMAELKKKEEK